MTGRQSGEEFARWTGQLLDRKGGRGIFIYDLRGVSTVTDFMVVVTGTSSRHIETLIDAPCVELKKMGLMVNAIEGRDSNWVVADFSDVILHVFDEATRQHYNLDGLWAALPRIEWEEKRHITKLISL